MKYSYLQTKKVLLALLVIPLMLISALAQGQIFVTNTLDDGAFPPPAGSLRQAIMDAPHGGEIVINLPAHSTITLSTQMAPANYWQGPIGIDKQLTIRSVNPVNIDGNGQQIFGIGWWDASPNNASNTVIENISFINAVDAISIGNAFPLTGITIRNCNFGIRSNGTTVVKNSKNGIFALGDPTKTITNLLIENCLISGNDENGIQLENVGSAIIRNNKIGTDATGNACAVTTGTYVDATYGGGNGFDGINLTSSSGVTIVNNLISCNGYAQDHNGVMGKRGVYLQGSEGNNILWNRIGTDIDGVEKLPNYLAGVLISQGSNNNIVEGNIVSGNGLNNGAYAGVDKRHGIVIHWGGTETVSTDNTIRNNRIGIDSVGACMGNSQNGIEIIGEGANNLIEANQIGCNGTNGISLSMGAHDNRIENNFIGTDAAGNDRGNILNGIILSTENGASFSQLNNNRILNNVIGFNHENGIASDGDERVSNLQITGNHIGIDRAGRPVPNQENGIMIGSQLSDISILNNFISNNIQHGINISPTGTVGNNNVIAGNRIGVGIDGTGDAGNGEAGIALNSNATDIQIGGTTPVQRNIISGNTGDGIYVTGSNTTNINIEGNNIGADINGAHMPNGSYGVQVNGAIGQIRIGGSTQAHGNNIYGNATGGVLISGAATTLVTVANNNIGNTLASNGHGVRIIGGVNNLNNNHIYNYLENGVSIANTNHANILSGNFIGFSQTFTANGNGAHGVSIQNSRNQNIINGNVIGNHMGGNAGVFIDNGINNNVRGNFIGTGTDGNSAAPNSYGVVITNSPSGNNRIGGEDPADRNIISGNAVAGVHIIGSSTNSVAGNLIGLAQNGTALGNGTNGVMLSGAATNNTIGGLDANYRNIISSHTGAGIDINGASNNSIFNNYIGTNTAGTVAIPNGNGISISGSSSANTIGGNASTGNLISGNTNNGIQITGGSNNSMLGNIIGLDETATAPLANGANGISISSSNGNTVGAENIISSNTANGVLLHNGAISNTITSATIAANGENGIDISASNNNLITANIIGGNGQGNTLDGIRIENASTGNRILNGNIISYNTGNGVNIVDGLSMYNPIRQNSFSCNLRGIEENGAGNQNFANKTPRVRPLIKPVGGSYSLLVDDGTYTTETNAIVDIYRKDACATCGSANVQGFTFIGSTTVDGNGSFEYALPGFVRDDSASYVISLSTPGATNINTSEFSDCSMMGCEDPQPVFAAIDSDSCGIDGRLVISNLIANATYDIAYNGDPNVEHQADMNGEVILRLPAGTYEDIEVGLDGCSVTEPGPFTLVAPAPLTFDHTKTDPTTCNGTEGTITLFDLTSGTSYNIRYDHISGATTTPFTGARIANASGEVILTGLAAGSYADLHIEVRNCEAGPLNEILTAMVPPVISVTASAGPTTCSGADGSITIDGVEDGRSYAVTYTRSGVITTRNIIAIPGNILVIDGLEAGTYHNMTVTIDNCQSNIVSATINDPVAPVISVVANDPSVCNATDGSILINGLLAGSTNSITYSMNGIAQPAISTTNSTHTITGLGAGNYATIRTTTINCVSNDTSVALINPGTPVISIQQLNHPATCGGNGSIILGGLIATNTYDIEYQRDGAATTALNNITSTDGSLTIPTLTQASYTNIRVSLSGTTCPSNMLAAVLADPAIPVLTVSGQDPTTCGGIDGRINITSGLIAGRNYAATYSGPGTATGTYGPITLAQNYITNIGSGGYSNIILTDQTTLCASDPVGPIALTDPARPTFDVVATNPTVCQGNGTLLIRDLIANEQYQIRYNDPTVVGPVPFISNAAGQHTLNLPQGNYTNIIVSRLNCDSDPVARVLTDPVIVPTVSINPVAAICYGVGVTFQAVPVNGGTTPIYEWRVGGTVVPGLTIDRYFTDTLRNGQQVTVTMTSSSPCAQPSSITSAPVTTTVYDTPAPVVTGGGTICAGQNSSLSATGGSTGSTYQWYRDDIAIPNARGASYNVTASGNFSVQITNGHCSARSNTVNVDVVSISVYAGPDQVIQLSEGERQAVVQLQATSNGENPRWTPASMITGANNRNASIRLSVGTYTVTFTDNIGSCSASDELTIRVKGPIVIPTAISPNGDGANDAWFITGLEGYDNYKIRVYNRYGNVVFSADDDYQPWDGMKNGSPMPVATYYFVVEVPEYRNFTGTLTIIR